ncbi:MAG: hypothetical protein ACM3H8_12305 [Sphingobacteriales bacterium]
MKPDTIDKIKNNTRLIILTITVIIFISGVINFIRNDNNYPRDLRNRVIGGRLLKKIISPYTYKWEQGDDDKLLDPFDNTGYPVNQITAAPSFLYIMGLISDFSFRNIAKVWLFGNYLILLLIVFFFYKEALTPGRKLLTIVFGLAFFTSSIGWITNTDGGQNYLLTPLLFTLMYWTYSSGDLKMKIVCGIIMAAALVLRPLYLPFIFPFLVSVKNRHVIYSCFSGIILYILFVCLSGTASVWKDYFDAMNVWAHIYTKETTAFSQAVKPFYPKIIEGYSNVSYTTKADEISSFFARFGSLTGINLSVRTLFFASVSSISIYLIFFFKKLKINKPSKQDLFLHGFILYQIVELLSPAPKHSYYLVELLFPVLLIIARVKVGAVPMILLTTAILMQAGAFNAVILRYAVSEYLMLLAMIIIAISKEEDYRIELSGKQK